MGIPLDWPTIRARLQGLLSFGPVAAEEEGELDTTASQPLSATVVARLKGELATLPEPPDRLQALQEAATKALHAWQADAGAPNTLTMAVEPVESPTKWLRELLAVPPFGGMTQVNQLQRDCLGDDCTATWEILQATFGLADRAAAVVTHGDREIVAIPDLSWCFLRCVEGLDAIEALLGVIAGDRSRFWLLGCNHWAWQYLKRVCDIDAYLAPPVAAEGPSKLALRNWLAPVTETLAPLGLQFPEREDPENPEGDDDAESWSSPAERRHFAQIAELSLGLPTIAAPLWLRSLRQVAASDADAEPTLTYATPGLPELPRLASDDRYLLYSLGLHGGLTLPALASSLGETEADTRARLQALRQTGLLVRESNRFAIAPLHYPRLKRDLNNNHLLLGGTP